MTSFPARPVIPEAEIIDASTLDRRSLAKLKVGALVTGINNTTSVFRVVGPSQFKRVQVGERIEEGDDV